MKMRRPRTLLGLVLLGLAFLHVRHQSTFIIVAVLVVPALLNSKPARSPLPKWLLLGFLPMLAYALISPRTPPEGPANPRSLIAAVPTALRSQPVFNEYSFGGPLILAGIKPYIDGRGELYGDAFVEDYSNIIGGDMAAFNRAAQRHDIVRRGDDAHAAAHGFAVHAGDDRLGAARHREDGARQARRSS